ncbi:hypothetical protein C1940_17090 (plasmid) [Lactiplantibacillus plantarum subsp. plantarum]|uniref:hypothetical protein n=1 Tax=Lactiplantibacillus plantarum TaxID=1590 RepID=UPI000CD363C4|nr:hypothetical protein [Lactiplantibacillus plantarum]AUV74167.1 hypothetical protein C1940_17090 [Lactiplantibacillus plantarum subsp. plantarum]
MTFLGLEIGSWAEWAGAIGTISAVILALWPNFRKIEHSKINFQFMLSYESDPLLIKIELKTTNLKDRVEFFYIENLEYGCEYSEQGQYPSFSSASSYEFHEFTDIPKNYLITLFAYGSVRDAVGSKKVESFQSKNEIVIVRMQGHTANNKDNYRVAKVYEVIYHTGVDKYNEINELGDFCEKNMSESEFNKLIDSKLKS